jgi:L-ascorbate metabolism protein UlaG (beta-lactamase superfamily)
MLLTRLGHACLLVESPSARILIDPGIFSNAWHELTDLDAVLVTHQHPDHFDVDNIGALIGANTGARLIAEPAVAEMLGDHAPQAAAVGDRVDLGDAMIEIVGGEHAVVHDSIPGVGNVGFVIWEGSGPTLFHPGDSYATTPPGIDLLALPLVAPWARAGMAIDFANAVRPGRAIPIHDAFLNDIGRATWMRICRGAIDETVAIDDPALSDLYTVQGYGH